MSVVFHRCTARVTCILKEYFIPLRTTAFEFKEANNGVLHRRPGDLRQEAVWFTDPLSYCPETSATNCPVIPHSFVPSKKFGVSA
jgi:hypothetical protein